MSRCVSPPYLPCTPLPYIWLSSTQPRPPRLEQERADKVTLKRADQSGRLVLGALVDRFEGKSATSKAEVTLRECRAAVAIQARLRGQRVRSALRADKEVLPPLGRRLAEGVEAHALPESEAAHLDMNHVAVSRVQYLWAGIYIKLLGFSVHLVFGRPAVSMGLVGLTLLRAVKRLGLVPRDWRARDPAKVCLADLTPPASLANTVRPTLSKPARAGLCQHSA